MPASGPANATWSTYETETKLSYLRTADTINDKLTAACNADPHLVHLGTSVAGDSVAANLATFDSPFAGRATVRYRSDLEQGKAEAAMLTVISREVSTVSEYETTLTDFGGEVVAPTVVQAGETIAAVASAGVLLYAFGALAVFWLLTRGR